MSCKVRLSRRISSAIAMRCESINLFVLVGLTTVACTETHFVGFLESMAPDAAIAGAGTLAISGEPPTAVRAGSPYSFQPAVSGGGKAVLTFSAKNAPTWASFEASSGRLWGTPSTQDVGTSSGIVISVSDGARSASLPPFSIVALRALYDWDAAYRKAFSAARSPSAMTRYVDPISGADTSVGTRDSPLRTLSAALGKTRAGDEVVVLGREVTVTDDDRWRVAGVPSGGGRTATTLVRAETPFGITLKWTTATNVQDGQDPLQLAGASNVWIDGFVFDVDTGSTNYVNIAEVTGDHNRITRCGFRRRSSVHPVAEHQSWIWVSGSFNVVEDCWGVGTAQYGFATDGQNNVFRRCVGRIDRYDYGGADAYTNAVFLVSGDPISPRVAGHHFQSVIAIDSVLDPLLPGTYAHGSVSSTVDIHLEDSIYLDCRSSTAGIYAQEQQSSQQAIIENCVVADSGAVSLAADSRNTSTSELLLQVERSTFVHPRGDGGARGVLEMAEESPGDTSVFRDNLLLDYDDVFAISSQQGFSTQTNNAFEAGGFGTRAAYAALKWLPRSPLPAQGDGGRSVGATIALCRGNIGEAVGEGSWDSYVPDRPLWPFPYEDAIKSGFLLATDPTSDPARGFCGGASLDGTPQTLTKYIWEYPIHGVQTPIPADAQ